MPDGLRTVLPRLRCPVCGVMFRTDGRSLRCREGHVFDVARQGYVHLAPGSGPKNADTAAMVTARDRFLTAGHYDPLAQAVTRAVAEATRAHHDLPPLPSAASTPQRSHAHGVHEARCVVDLGAGTGYYLAAVLRANPGWDGIAVDSSKPALRRAAQAHPRIGAVVADTTGRVPIADGVASVVLNVFAPRGPSEMGRVLHADGSLIVVTPTGEHLHELVAALGLLNVHPHKDEHIAGQLSADFTRVQRETLRWTMALDHPSISDLVGMGPSAWHIPTPVLKERISALAENGAVTGSVRIGTYRRRGDRHHRGRLDR